MKDHPNSVFSEQNESAPSPTPNLPRDLSQAAPFLGTGIKIGEVTQDSAVVWARLTSVKDGDPTSQTKAAPGAKGFFSVSFRLADEKAPFGPHIIVKVSAAHDHANQITLKKATALTLKS